MYIIRTAFWLSVVILLIPGDPQDAPPDGPVDAAANTGTEQVSAGDAVNAALSTIGDFAGICARQPDVCETGAAAWQVFQRKAIAGVDMIYRWTTGEDRTDRGVIDATPVHSNQATAITMSGSFQVADNTLADSTEAIHTGSADNQSSDTASGTAPASQNTLRIDDLIPSWGGPAQTG